MKLPLLCLGLACAGTAIAAVPVGLTVGPDPAGCAIPDDFVGLSFGSITLLPEKAGPHAFSPSDAPMVTLFQNIGIRHLRIGGTTVESPPETPIPNEREIDDVFAFARAAGVKKVIYSLRLLEAGPTAHYAAADAAIAKYIWDHDRPQLDCFSIGNEPERRAVFKQDTEVRDFPTYLAKWRRFAAAVTAAVPDAKFGGPDGGSGNVTWTTGFAAAEKPAGILSVVTEHYYSGGAGRGVTARQGIDAMLSPAGNKGYRELYEKMAVPVMAGGAAYRFTEANDHYSGGIPGASDTFAGALWALDYLHWWAAHAARGVDFHNTEWVSSDVIRPDSAGRLMATPKAYGLRAFALGGHGRSANPVISNPDGVNLTAYAVNDGDQVWVTVINREHGPGARDAAVTIGLEGFAPRVAAAILLTAPGGAAAATAGVTLGGAAIANDTPWRETWSPLSLGADGRAQLAVPATSAAVVRLTTARIIVGTGP